MSDSQKKIVVQDNTINSLTELDLIQKERVQLAFREGTIRGFDIKGLPIYIKSQTGIDISYKLVLRLRRIQSINDRRWFVTYARDQYAYIGVYRKCIDELDSLRKECWALIMLKTTKEENKIAAMKEIHNIVKTQVLLLRDLPFIMDLSKYYDPNIIDIGQKPKPIQKLAGNQSNHDKTHEHPLNSHLHKTLFDAVNNKNLQDMPMSLPHKVLDEIDERKAEVLKNVDDEILDTISKQLDPMTEDDKEQYDKIESAKKEQEANNLRKIVKDYEDSLREEFKTTGNLNLEKVEELQHKAESNLSYLEALTTEQERSSIKRLKEIREPD